MLDASGPSRPDNALTIELALRCYPLVAGQKAAGIRRRRSTAPPEFAFVFDTETTTDHTQQLTFGSYRFLQRAPDAGPFVYECIGEGLFHANDPPPGARERLQAYARAHGADVSPNGSVELPVYSLHEFVQHFYTAARGARALVAGFNLPFDLSRIACGVGEARKGAFGGFSLPIVTRRSRDGAFVPNTYRARITLKSIDSKRSLKQWTYGDEDPTAQISEGADHTRQRYYYRGDFLELRTLAFALTDRGHTLDSACEAFGVERKGDPDRHLGWDFDDEYIDYNRRDTRITASLLFAMLQEYAHHPIAVAPVNVYSPASIGKGYLEAMGVSPPLKRWPGFSKEHLGYSMTTFYGGRTSARIRRHLVPVRYCDFLSQYPTTNALLGTWDLLTAADYRIVDATDRARALLDGLTLDQLFDKATWPQLGFFARIVPQGDVLPVRAKWESGDARQIGVNPLTTQEPLWYAGPDLAASLLLSGKVPRIEEAFAIEPGRDRHGKVIRAKALRPVQLLGTIPVDPASENFFLKVIEERKRATADKALTGAVRERYNKGLKVVANATSYGILAQMDPVDLRVGEYRAVEVYGANEPFPTHTTKPEKAGEYFFPPIAALITAGARCMLAMLERSVADCGGTYAMEDTDSMAIVATQDGGLVPCPGGAHAWTPKLRRAYRGPQLRDTREAVYALSFAEVDAIIERFAALNPYGPPIEGSILKLEDVNLDEHRASRQVWCYAISSKRYCLITLDERGEPHVARNDLDEQREAQCSEHGLGHLLNPVDLDSDDRKWIVQAWEAIVREHLGLPSQREPWADRAALTRMPISTPNLLRSFARNDERKPYAERVKPFNFLLAGHTAPLGFPHGVDPKHFLLVAPYERDPKRWLKLRWTDVHFGQSFGVTTSLERHTYDPETALLQTYADALGEFRLHPEAKSLRPGGEPCDERQKNCAGLLARRPAFVPLGWIEYIGKEMNELDHVMAGVVGDEDDIITRLVDPRSERFGRFRILLRAIPKRWLIEHTGISKAAIERIRNAKGKPHPQNQAKLLGAIVEYFSDRPPPMFEAIERLGPQRAAVDLRERAIAIAAETGEAVPSQQALDRARRELVVRTGEELQRALSLLGL